jgi:hypothetical protein
VQLAQSAEELRAAFHIMAGGIHPHRSSLEPEARVWAVKQHALPTTHVFVWKDGPNVHGTCTLFLSGPMGTPWECEKGKSIKPSKDRYAEISFPICSTQFTFAQIELIDFALRFSRIHCLVEEIYMAIPAPLLESIEPSLRLIEVSEGLYQIKSILSYECRSEFRWPNRQFYRIGHQQWPPGLFKEIFVRETNILKSLNQRELQFVLNNYDLKQFSPILREVGHLQDPSEERPKHPRHSTLCYGQIFYGGNTHCNVEILDVSREGMKIKADDVELEIGLRFPMKLSVGPRQTSEVIAEVIWISGAREVGLKVLSGDHAWAELNNFLEQSCDERLVAA